jgi:ligand-binding sensor domain-containing protein/two-component sensor histidine kinase
MQKWICCLWGLLAWSGLAAQVYNVTRYSTDDGLVQSQVMALMQDQYGYLWMGTHRGACKFDGQQFFAYGAEEGLNSTFLSDLEEDSSGGIWMTTDGGLSHWDGHRFRNYTSRDGLPGNDLTCLLRDQRQRLWIGTQSEGLALYQGDQIEANPFAWPDSQQHSVGALLQDRKGRIWIGTLEGLYYKDPNEPRLQQLRQPGFDAEAEVHALLQDRAGRIWIGTTLGLYCLDDQQMRYYDLKQPDLPDRVIYCMSEDAEGQLWLGTGNGIIRYDGEEFLPLGRGDRLLAYRMASVIIDQEGNIWFGTDGGGVRKISDGVFESYAMQDNLSSNLAKSFLEDEQGRIWISTKDRGINLYQDGRIVAQYTTRDGLGGDDICTSFEDSQGQFWFASYNGTLTRYRAGRFRAFGRAEGLACNAVYWVTQDPRGQLWVGTDNGIFTQQDGHFQRELSTGNGLEDNTIYSILIDRQSRMWIGSSAGLMVQRDGEVHSLVDSEVVGNNVIALLEDPEGRIWVGSSLGLTCFAGPDIHRVRISGAPGAETVVGLTLEDRRYLWVATENGAYRLDLSDFDPQDRARFEHYTQKDGLPSLECNANAAFEDSRGAVWIGTAEGAIRRPEGTQRRSREQPLQVYITQVRSTQDTSWQARGFEVDAFGLPQELVLPYTENRLDFSFIGISLRSPQQVEYRFRMEGVDQGWSRPTRQTSVFYPNLDPGTYTFRVTAKRETGNWNYDNADAFTFTIQRPFWQAWWFIGMMLLLLGGISYGVYDNIATRRRRYSEQRRLQNAAEKLQLEHQALYAMMNPHFTFNALQSIQYFIHRQDRKSANKFLSSFAKLVRKNLESTKVDFISLSEEVERLKLYMSLEKMRFPEKFDYEVRVEPGLDLNETQLPAMLLQPFVENSIKHGIMSLESNGLITIEIHELDEDYLRILIRDNGIGIEASKQRRANRPNDHVSKGMQITIDRLALFARITGKQYSLDIHETQDEQGQVSGTTVEMVLPIREEVIT